MISRKRSRSRSVSPAPLRPEKLRKVDNGQGAHALRVDTEAFEIGRNASTLPQAPLSANAVDHDISNDGAMEITSANAPAAAVLPNERAATESHPHPQHPVASSPKEVSAQGTGALSKEPIRTPISKNPTETWVDSHQQPVQFVYETPATMDNMPLEKKTRATRSMPKAPVPKLRRSRLSSTVTATSLDPIGAGRLNGKSTATGTSKLIPDKDLVPAIVGVKDESLAHIMCTHRITGQKKELHFKQLDKMDWNDADWIERFNNWSSQIYRRAGKRRKQVKVWHEDEETWLEIFVFKMLIQAMKPENQQQLRMPTREVLTRHFNNFFEGRVLLNAMDDPLPPRTARVPGAVISKLDRFHLPIQKQVKEYLLSKGGDVYMPQITSDMFGPFRAARKVLVNGLRGMYKGGKLDRRKLSVDLELIGGPDQELQLWQTFLDAVKDIGTDVNVANMLVTPSSDSKFEEEGDILINDSYEFAVSSPAPAPAASKGLPKKVRAPGTKVKGARVAKNRPPRTATKALQKSVAHVFRGHALSKLSGSDLANTESLLRQMSDAFQHAYPRRAHSVSRAGGKSAWDDGTLYDANEAL